MLKQEDVEAEEERLRGCIRALSDEQRQAFFQEAKKALKDPDTYAALNWFFITGIHHFYLGRWWHGAFDLIVFAVGFTLLFSSSPWLGVALILMVSVWELWALFRAQIIIQDWNNKVYQRLLQRYLGTSDT